MSIRCNKFNLSGGNGKVYNGANINPGNLYWWDSGIGNINNLNINGGTLVICDGVLNLNNVNFNSGNIVVLGGTLIFLIKTLIRLIQ